MTRLASVSRTVSRYDGQYTVRTGLIARKIYICPGCGQSISLGQQHVVAWREGSIMGARADLESRRHWHTACWQRGLRPLN
ncbi:hypothetical protein KRX54_06445 [Actinomycetaceae bacterium TAE3-ERU4]|nr:hypothetical protein [Actinomycetaceae bacterium TAE3-ERU4]